jgi:hypothetical protein
MKSILKFFLVGLIGLAMSFALNNASAQGHGKGIKDEHKPGHAKGDDNKGSGREGSEQHGIGGKPNGKNGDHGQGNNGSHAKNPAMEAVKGSPTNGSGADGSASREKKEQDGHGNSDHGKGGHDHSDHDKGHDGSHGSDNPNNDFGQARAEAARAKHKEVTAVTETTLSDEEKHVKAANDKIAAAKAALETMKTDKKADMTVIAQKEELIRQAEAKVKLLDAQIKQGKATVESAKAALPALAK